MLVPTLFLGAFLLSPASRFRLLPDASCTSPNSIPSSLAIATTCLSLARAFTARSLPPFPSLRPHLQGPTLVRFLFSYFGLTHETYRWTELVLVVL